MSFLDWPDSSYADTALNTWSSSPYFNQAQSIAQARGVDPGFFAATIGAESGYDTNASNGDAQGIAQFILSTAQTYGVNRQNPISSITGAANYFSDLLDSCGGDYVCASAKYGTLPTSCTYGACNNLTPNQQLVLQTAENANTNNGSCVNLPAEISLTGESGSTGTFCTGSSTTNYVKPSSQTCSSYDVICNAKTWLSNSGANLLSIVAGMVLLVIGIVMLRDNVGLLEAAKSAPSRTVDFIANTKHAPKRAVNGIKNFASSSAAKFADVGEMVIA